MDSRPPFKNLGKAKRRAVFARDGGVCWICGRPGATTLDHVVPRSLGGSDEAHNLRAAHATCNYRRGTDLPPAPVTSRAW